jgi:hypothetical protein
MHAKAPQVNKANIFAIANSQNDKTAELYARKTRLKQRSPGISRPVLALWRTTRVMPLTLSL